jgi:hypothetical protein
MLNVQFSLSISLSRRLAAPKHSDGGSEDRSVAKAEVLQHKTKLEVLRWLAAWRSFTRSQFQDFHPFTDRLEMQTGL